MTTDVRHDCRFCSHSNDSHDPLIGCLYPNCMCANKYPATSAVLASVGQSSIGRTYGTPRTRKPRQRRVWAVLRWLLGTTAAAVLAALVLAGAFLVAVVLLVVMGS